MKRMFSWLMAVAVVLMVTIGFMSTANAGIVTGYSGVQATYSWQWSQDQQPINSVGVNASYDVFQAPAWDLLVLGSGSRNFSGGDRLYTESLGLGGVLHWSPNIDIVGTVSGLHQNANFSNFGTNWGYDAVGYVSARTPIDALGVNIGLEHQRLNTGGTSFQQDTWLTLGAEYQLLEHVALVSDFKYQTGARNVADAGIRVTF